MVDGMLIGPIVTDLGLLSIGYVDDMCRAVRVDDNEYRMDIRARSERWNSVLGVYTPGFILDNNLGVRIVYQEAQQDFISDIEFFQWCKFLYRSYSMFLLPSGLLVAYKYDENGKQINVDLWQIYISGEPYGGGDELVQDIDIHGHYNPKANYRPRELSRSVNYGSYSISGRVMDYLRQVDIPVSAIGFAMEEGKTTIRSDGYTLYEWGPVNRFGGIDHFRCLRVLRDSNNWIVYVQKPTDLSWLNRELVNRDSENPTGQP